MYLNGAFLEFFDNFLKITDNSVRFTMSQTGLQIQNVQITIVQKMAQHLKIDSLKKNVEKKY